MVKTNDTRPDVAVLVPNLQGGGAERIAVALVNRFIQRGYSVDVVLKHKAGDLLPLLSKEANLIEVGKGGLHGSMRSTMFDLRRVFHERRPRVVFSHLDTMNLPALWAAKLWPRSMPVVVTVHNAVRRARAARSLRSRVKPTALATFYPLADAVVAVSEGAADQVRSLMLRNRSRVVTIPNFVPREDPTALAAEPSYHPWLESKMAPVILGVGGFIPQKDFPTLIRAFAELRKVRKAKLIIVGDAWERPHLENLVRELGLTDDVDMPGFKPNPLAFMSRADVYVLSSAWEGFGLVLVEALACGTQVVSTDCQFGPREILNDGEYGRLVPVGDPSAMAQAILQTLDNPLKTKEELRERAAYYSLDRAVDQYLKVLGLEHRTKEETHDLQTT